MTDGEDTKTEKPEDDASARAFVIVLQPYARPEMKIPVNHYLAPQHEGPNILDVWSQLETARLRGWFTARREDGSPEARIDLAGCIIEVFTLADHEKAMAEMKAEQEKRAAKQQEEQAALAQRLSLVGPGMGLPPGTRVVPRGGRG